MSRLRQAALFGAIIEGEADTIVLDVTSDDVPSDDGHAVDHEVEDGGTIQDHVVLEPTKLTLRGILSDTPHTAPAEEGRAVGMYRSLLAMRDARERVAVITELRVYDPFVIESVRPFALEPAQAAIGVVVEGKVVRIVSPERVFLPPERVRDSPAGTADRLKPETDEGQKWTDKIAAEDATAIAGAAADNRTGMARTLDATGLDASSYARQTATGGFTP